MKTQSTDNILCNYPQILETCSISPKLGEKYCEKHTEIITKHLDKLNPKFKKRWLFLDRNLDETFLYREIYSTDKLRLSRRKDYYLEIMNKYGINEKDLPIEVVDDSGKIICGKKKENSKNNQTICVCSTKITNKYYIINVITKDIRKKHCIALKCDNIHENRKTNLCDDCRKIYCNKVLCLKRIEDSQKVYCDDCWEQQYCMYTTKKVALCKNEQIDKYKYCQKHYDELYCMCGELKYKKYKYYCKACFDTKFCQECRAMKFDTSKNLCQDCIDKKECKKCKSNEIYKIISGYGYCEKCFDMVFCQECESKKTNASKKLCQDCIDKKECKKCKSNEIYKIISEYGYCKQCYKKKCCNENECNNLILSSDLEKKGICESCYLKKLCGKCKNKPIISNQLCDKCIHECYKFGCNKTKFIADFCSEHQETDNFLNKALSGLDYMEFK